MRSIIVPVIFALIGCVLSRNLHKDCDSKTGYHNHDQGYKNSRSSGSGYGSDYGGSNRGSNYEKYHHGDYIPSPARAANDDWGRGVAAIRGGIRVLASGSRRAGGSRNETAAAAFGPPAVHWGCYYDDNMRMLRGSLHFNDQMHRGWCVSQCERQNYRFAGIEVGRECWCGNSFDRTRYPRRPSQECTFRCPLNREESCGGYWRLDLLEIIR